MFEHLDLGNLMALHVLLEERNVTRAARRLGLTLSSMSHSP
jgi:DNA-binding transcriptional LysR family regulator